MKVELLNSEVIKILESLAFDNFDKNRHLMQKLISQISIPVQYQERIMDRLEYFTKELLKVANK